MSDQSRTKIIGLIVIVLLTSVGTVGAVAYNNRPLSQSTVSATALPVGSATTSSSGTQTSSTSSSTTTATTN
jgi:hypothetical protein